MVTTDDIEVVISGIGGSLPKSNNIEDFGKLLFSHEEMVQTSESDPNITFGTIDGQDRFDSTFFGITRTIAVSMDMLYRKSLENTFEAIIDAGISPTSIRGKKIAVIMGSTFTEMENNIYNNIQRGAGVVTQARAMLANRVSYWMHATGPSYSMHNNWISGMTSLEAAYNLIKSGQCEGAIVGAVNGTGLINVHSAFTSLDLISKTGKTRPFDENAAGYVRSGGVVVLFLQRADLARRHYSTIVHVETIFNGNNSGTYFTMSVDSARNFLTNFYQRANVDPSAVQYVETYGAAVQFLDNFELNVLDEVYNNSSRTEPLLIGSVKSNMGHCEATSVFASVIKTIIAMEKREIPANLNYEHKNEKISALREGKIRVVAENTPWEGTLAAVNGYGLVSSCGHILLKSNTQIIKKDVLDEEKLPQLYIFSTRTEEGANEIIEKIKSYDTLNNDYMKLINNVFTHNIPGHLYRGCLIRNKENKAIEQISHYSGEQRPVWFVYSGMGSQWITMGRGLMHLPIFAAAIKKCHAVLEPHGINLMKIICSDEDPNVFGKILHSFVGIAAIQIGLTDILYALGIKPDYMIGHSVGELGCSYADGCLTAEQMILSAYYRGRASQEVELIPGLMAAVGVGASQVKRYLPDTVDIACRNGPESCTLSGPAEDMQKLVAKLQGCNIFARAVDVAGIAYHSRYIKPAAPLLYEYLKKIIPHPKLRSAKWLCSSIPEANGGWESETAQYASPDYLTNNLLSCVHFEPLLEHIPSDAIVIEIAPHGLLQAILKRSIPNTCTNIALTKRGEEKGVEFLLKSIGQLYLAGLQPNVSELYKDEDNKGNALMPCSRNTPSLAPLVRWNHTDLYETAYDASNESTVTELTFSLNANSEYFRYLNGHRIYDVNDDDGDLGTITVPISTYLSLVVNVKDNSNNTRPKAGNVIFEDVQLYRHRIISGQINTKDSPITLMTLLGSNYFEVNDQYGIVAAGKRTYPTEKEMTSNKTMSQNMGQKIETLTRDELYRELNNRGHNFQNDFLAVQTLEIYEKGMVAKIEWKSEWHTFVSAMLQMPIFRFGQSSHLPIDTVYIRSLSCFLKEDNIPKEGSMVEVTYNFTTDTISSSVITVCGACCQSYKIERDLLIADKSYPVADSTVSSNGGKIAAININEPTVKIADLKSKLPWAKTLNDMLVEGSFDYIYLVMRVLPANGIDSFLANVQTLPNGNRARLIITLDTDTPQFNAITDKFYQPAFKQRESNVSVYCKGTWEYRYTVSTNLNGKNIEMTSLTSLITEQDIKRYLPDVNVRFVGINTVSMVPTLSNKMSYENQLGVIDYAGLEKKTNQQVMGLATINNKNSLRSDGVLRWTMPKHWTVADGATVPFAYSIAYYALHECAALQPGDSILIHNGCSSIGQAMIRIADTIGCVIYTTVASERQRSNLLKTMQMLQSSKVYDYTSNNFEFQIMAATEGEGVQVLVNCLPEDSLRAGLRCVASLGRVILLLDENRLEEQYQESIGLSTFFRCFGMYGIRATKILDLPEETKKTLHKHILTGLQKNHILPINKTIFRENGRQPLNKIVEYLTGPTVTGTAVVPIEDLVNNKYLKTYSNQVHKVDSTYIVYGGEDIDNIITLTSWLATTYGAKNIAILSSHCRSTNDKKHLERKITAIKTDQKGVSIQLLEVTANKPDLVLEKIIQQKITNIAGLLILSNGNNQYDELFIKKLQMKFPNTHVVLLGSVANLNVVNLERYQARNFTNVSFLRWDSKRRLTSVVKSLTTALDEVVDIFVRNDKVIETRENVKVTFSIQDFCSLLSSSVPSILKCNPIESSVKVEPMVNKNSRHTIDLAPMFVIPGLLGSKCTYLQSIVKNLLNPAYILDATYGTLSLDQIAKLLGKQISKIYPSGPYNLIGVSTGGPLAIELAKHLETDLGATVQLYLLDGVPDTIKYLLKPSDNKYEATLLTELLNIKDPKVTASLSALPNWNAKIDAACQQISTNSKEVKQILQVIKNRIDAAVTYSPDKRNFNGVTHVVMPKDTIAENAKVMDELKQVKLKIIKGNHFTMLQEHSLMEYINEHVIHPAFYLI